MRTMDERLLDLYRLPNIADYEDVHLLTLRENCAVLEDQVRDVLSRVSDHDRYILQAYIDMRNELEFETVKTALRWGKNSCK